MRKQVWFFKKRLEDGFDDYVLIVKAVEIIQQYNILRKFARHYTFKYTISSVLILARKRLGL